MRTDIARTGGLLLIAASVLGLLVALYDYFFAWGINHSIGATIVCASMALMMGAALVIVLDNPPGWARVVLGIGIVIDCLGTALAAYFLESGLLVVLALLAGAGWLVFVVGRTGAAGKAATERAA